MTAVVEILRIEFSHGEPASPLRLATRTVLQRDLPAWDEDSVEDALVVVSELVQNVNQHTCSGGELALNIVAGGVLIEVRDQGPGSPRIQGPDEHRIGGRGLLLVAGVAEDWGVRRTGAGKIVWARLPIGPAAQSAPAA